MESRTESNESAGDAGARESDNTEPPSEAEPEEPPREWRPPPQGLGTPCLIGPRGDNCPNGAALVCVAPSGNKGTCFEDCLKTPCSDPKAQCISTGQRGVRACFGVAKVGEECGFAQQHVCNENRTDPPEYCIAGKCKARPNDGWGENENCTPPKDEPQSDCKANLECIALHPSNFRCLQPCSKNEECPNDRVCNASLGRQVCVIPAKSGERCAKEELRFCDSSDPKFPLKCNDQGTCESALGLKGIGEDCTPSTGANPDPRGDCDRGLLCLNTGRARAVCHTSCKNTADCPQNESCAEHPDQRHKVCVIPVELGKPCDMVKRRVCVTQSSAAVRCEPNPNGDPGGVCKALVPGKQCTTDADCGQGMKCTGIAGGRFCFVPCTGGATCPNQGICTELVRGQFLCALAGPRKPNETCNPRPSSKNGVLDTSQSCLPGHLCHTFQQGATQGLCLKYTMKCDANACAAGYICAQSGKGFICGQNCSLNPLICQNGTKCTTLPNATKICGLP